MKGHQISLKILLQRFWSKTILTWVLVIFEGLALLLIPLVIGWAVDDLLNNDTLGIFQLTALCAVLLIIGAGRRFYDTRIYSGIYRKVSNEMISREIRNKTSVSKISARTNLFTEFIGFLENSLPEILNHLVCLTGTLFIICFIDFNIFLTCIAGAAATWITYLFSQKKILRLNKGKNDELEKQVELIADNHPGRIKDHFKRLINWNIRLSDLETINFSITWITLAGVLICSIILVSSNSSSLGHIITITMYVFGFIESIMAFPVYYQQVVRLNEIAGRLG